MRRLFVVITAALLVLAMASPVLANRGLHNKHIMELEISCPAPYGTFTVLAYKTPGWEIAAEPGTPPWQAMSGTITYWVAGQQLGPYSWQYARGLEDVIGPCTMQLVGGDPVSFDVQIADAYLHLPAN
ncbi:MAG: hypothetical protein FIA92_15570 [Chloroflexi bacterium]|nr:hypothetical protein [Chloroflexota bacterium]